MTHMPRFRCRRPQLSFAHVLAAALLFEPGCGSDINPTESATVFVTDSDSPVLPNAPDDSVQPAEIDNALSTDSFIIATQLPDDPGTWEFVVTAPSNVIAQVSIFEWNFGDGTILRGSSQIHTFQTRDRYIVTLTAFAYDESVLFIHSHEIDLSQLYQAPVADAGEDQIVDAGATVFLDTGESAGAANSELSYSWSQTLGPAVVLIDADQTLATFQAPQVGTEPVVLEFRLLVTDWSAAATDYALVTVRASAAPLDDDPPPPPDQCRADSDCDDGVYCNGAETCVGGSCESGIDPCAGQQCDETSSSCAVCLTGAHCDNGLFCDGVETCAAGACQSGDPPCNAQICDEANRACVDCLDDAICNDQIFCNGAEVCVNGSCLAGSDPCFGQRCDESNASCVECLLDQHCDNGLFCDGEEACVAGACAPGLDPCPGQECDETGDSCLGGFTCPTISQGIQVGSVLRSDVVEASGLAASRRNPNVLWTHDDSGGDNVAFALNRNGTFLGTYRFGAGSVSDAEDIALGPGPIPGVDYLFFGDIGDNGSSRASITVKRAPEPVVDAQQAYTTATLDAVDIIKLQYPTGATAPAHKDAETLFVDLNGDLYIVTKRMYPNKVYRARYPQSTSSTNTLEYVVTLPTGPGLNWITGGDLSADGQWIIVTNDQAVDYANLWYRPPGTDLSAALLGTPCAFVLQSEPQGEAIAWDPVTPGFFTLSEAHNSAEPIWYYQIQ